MKLEYQKPYLAVESFQLNAAIAGSCADKPYKLNHSIEICTLNLDTTDFFGPNCVEDVTTIEGTNNEPCYHSVVYDIGDVYVDS